MPNSAESASRSLVLSDGVIPKGKSSGSADTVGGFVPGWAFAGASSSSGSGSFGESLAASSAVRLSTSLRLMLSSLARISTTKRPALE